MLRILWVIVCLCLSVFIVTAVFPHPPQEAHELLGLLTIGLGIGLALLAERLLED